MKKPFYMVLLCLVLGAFFLWLFEDTMLVRRACRFLSFQDGAVCLSVLGCMLLGANCGGLGSFMILRKMALVGDTLSHAILPGVVLGFLWAKTKDPLSIFVGAMLASLLSTVCISILKKTTIIKEDSILGIVLSGFYALGICLLTMVQNQDISGKAGLHTFLLGQACALSGADVYWITCSTIVSLLLLAIFYKEWLATSFDEAFSKSVGIKTGIFHYLLMFLLAFGVVTGLQATGALLITALLILPGATAYLLTDKLYIMLPLAILIGVFSSFLGVFVSFLGLKSPTGPLIVISAGFLFSLAFFFSPQKGIVFTFITKKREARRIALENTLKHIYKILEKEDFIALKVPLQALCVRLNWTLPKLEKNLKLLQKKGFLCQQEKDFVQLTSSGLQKARSIVRNHRLWELYLIHFASYAKDHVHDDAENIEHYLSPELVQKLEKDLRYPQKDPHGMHIPSVNL